MRIKETSLPLTGQADACPHTADEMCACSPILEEAPDNILQFIEGDDLYHAMLADIASAQQRIQLESYIFPMMKSADVLA